MKSKILLAFLVAALPLSAFAHGNKAAMTAEASVAAVEQFEKDFGDAGIDAFTGLRAWPSGANMMVRVYLSTATKQVDYTCEHMDQNGQRMIMCKK